jgi:hypothetical protein
MSSGQPTNNRTGHKKPELTERHPPRDHKLNSRPGDRERRPTQSRLSKEETDRLHAEQRCFSCKEVGHEIRNCPNRRNAKAPTLSAGSINIARLEAKGNRAREVNMSVGAIRVGSAQITDLEGGSAASGSSSEYRAYPASSFSQTEGISESSTPSNRHLAPLASQDLDEVETDGEQLRRMFCVYYGCKPDSTRFTVELVETANTFEILDAETRRVHWCSRHDFGRDEFCVEWLLGMNNFHREVLQYSVPFCPDADKNSHPATAWLQDGIHSLARSHQWGTFGDFDVQIQEVDVGFRGLVHVYITHDEIRARTFSVWQVLDRAWFQFQLCLERGAEDNGKIEPGLYAGAIKTRGPKSRRASSPTTDSVERTAMKVHDFKRVVPKPIVVTVFMNGHPVRALMDCGSEADFLSTSVIDQLRIPRSVLAKPLNIRLAVHGSCSKTNADVTVQFKYQDIDESRKFDVANLDAYDVILGTPFLFQHSVMVGFNPSRVIVGSNDSLEMRGTEVTTVTSAAADIFEDDLQKVREMLAAEAMDLCPDTSKTALPPFRAVNHVIPLIDESKIYKYRPARCLEALKALWQEKRDAYLANSCWRRATGNPSAPMLIMVKPTKADGIIRIRTVLDKRAINENTRKLASPLPDINGILRNVARHCYRSLLDGKDAYEQIRVVDEHVPHTLFSTPDGTMESLTLQQGDCNGPATYQTLMNHIFAPFIGVFMDVYLDDIVIYSDMVEDHLAHIRTVFDVLRREKLYLSSEKWHFFASSLKILGHVIDDKGILMDPHKVDAVLKWKVPTNKDLLASFIGAVGFLAEDCKGIRIPMGVLTPLSSGSKPWRWSHTEQRAFDEVKTIVDTWRDNHRLSVDYSPKAHPIFLNTDACCTGASGYVSQGLDWKTAKVVTFWSGKFNSAQQNYPVHEQELLAIVESLKHFHGILHGTRFQINTDHRTLQHFMGQKNLSPRQHRWLDILNEFSFTINYIPGETNILANALSRIYSDEPKGMVRAESEYVGKDDEDSEGNDLPGTTRPLYTGSAAVVPTQAPSSVPHRSTRLAELGAEKHIYTEPRATHMTTTPKTKHQRATVRKESRPARDAPSFRSAMLETAGGIGIDLPQCLQNRYREDEFFTKVLEQPETYSDFATYEGLVFKQSGEGFMLCIPNVMVNERSVREVVIRHSHSLLAHLGHKKTLAMLRAEVWWRTMVDDVEKYCRSCPTCAMSKPNNQQAMGLLKTLPVPHRPWQSIGIDFVGPLPESSNRSGTFDMICVIIDHLTSMIHLTPTKQTYGARHIAEVVFDTVYKLHGLPEKIISDRDSLFTSTFWKRLHELLGVELRLSSAYHPQTDGATERANHTMTQMLHQCVRRDQRDWAERLPAIEFAMNSARLESTGFSPFFLNYAHTPHPLIWNSTLEFPGVEDFAAKLKEALMKAHDAIIDARVKQTKQANRHRRRADFKVDELVYLSTKNLQLPKGQARKLVPKYIGPFKIIREVSTGASYQLELSKELKTRGVHNVFHASLLRQHYPNNDWRFPGRQLSQLPGFGQDPAEWQISRVLSHSGCGREAVFEVQWSTGDMTWVPYVELADSAVLDEYFEAMGISRLKDLAAGPPHPAIEVSAARVAPSPTAPVHGSTSGDKFEIPGLPMIMSNHKRWTRDWTYLQQRSFRARMPFYQYNSRRGGDSYCPPPPPQRRIPYAEDSAPARSQGLVASDQSLRTLLNHQLAVMAMFTGPARPFTGSPTAPPAYPPAYPGRNQKAYPHGGHPAPAAPTRPLRDRLTPPAPPSTSHPANPRGTNRGRGTLRRNANRRDGRGNTDRRRVPLLAELDRELDDIREAFDREAPLSPLDETMNVDEERWDADADVAPTVARV